MDSYVEMSDYDETENEVFHFEMASNGGDTVKRRTVVLSKRQVAQTTSLESKISKMLSGNQEVDTAVLLKLLSKKINGGSHEG